MFYGWKIVAVAFLSLFVSVGFGFYSFGAFFKALAAELGGSRLGVGLGLSIFSMTNGLLGPLLGRTVDRGSIRAVMSAGVLLLATGFVVMSRVQALWQFYVVLGTLMAFGAALIGGLTTSTLVANWFVRRRGTALGIATMGISLSGVVMAPTATLLIERFGWRHTFLIYAALTVLIVLPAVRLLVVDRPENVGLLPDGELHPGPRPDPGAGPRPTGQAAKVAGELPAAGSSYVPYRFSLRGTLSQRNFWVIVLVVSLNFSANGAVLTHIIPHVTDLGFASERAALVLSAIAALGVVGKLVFGWVSDHVDIRLAMWLSSGLQALGVGVFLLVDAYPLLLLGGAVFGLGMGGLVPLWGSMIGAAFGRLAFGRVMGLMGPFLLPLQIIGVPFAGWVFDTTGRYAPAFQLFIVLYVGAMAILSLLRLPAREPGTAVEAPA